MIRKNEVVVPREESISQPSIHLDLPEYQESPSGDRRPANMTSWSSPVLGESVSMYEELGREAEAEVVENQEEVAELLLQHKPSSSLSSPSSSSPAEVRLQRTQKPPRESFLILPNQYLSTPG